MKVSTKQLAVMLGLTPQRVNQLTDAGSIPKSGRNEFDLDVCIQAYVQFRVAESHDGECENDLETERTRLTKHKADIAEMESDLMKGKVFDGDAVRAVMTDLISSAKSKFTAHPSRAAGAVRDLVAKHCPPDVVEKINLVAVRVVLEDACRESLQELSDYDPKKFVDTFVSKHSSDLVATPEGDDVGVGRSKSKAK